MLNKINLRLLDLLTIMLPGGLLLMVIIQIRPIDAFWDSWQSMITEGWQKAGLFAAASFVLGHFIYLLASGIDNLVFEKARNIYYRGNALLAYVIQLKNETLGITDRNIMNAYKWALAVLISQSPSLYEAVEQHIASSKFFRSFFVVLLIAFIALLFYRQWLAACVMFVLAILSLVRYFTQRIKSIESAYHYVLVLSGKKFNDAPDPAILSALNSSYYDKTFPRGVAGQVSRFWFATKLCFGWKPKDNKTMAA